MSVATELEVTQAVYAVQEFDLIAGKPTGRNEFYVGLSRGDVAQSCLYTRGLTEDGWRLGRSGFTLHHPSSHLAWFVHAEAL